MPDQKGYGVRIVDTLFFILFGGILLHFLQRSEPIPFSSLLFVSLLLSPILRSVIFSFLLPASSSLSSPLLLSSSSPQLSKIFIAYPLLIFYFYLISLCYGAPFSSPRTLLFAAYLASFPAPLTPFLGSSPLSLVQILASFPSLPTQQQKTIPLSPLLHFSHTTMGALVGTWVGALPIPLDWDRWWQVWPISCVFGCLGGAFVGSLLSLLVAWRGVKVHNR